MNFVLKELWIFFSQNQENTIEFWECLSCSNWCLHNAVNKNTKSFGPVLLLLCKWLWDFSKKSECNDIIKTWKIIFQASDSKEKHFLDLVDSNDNLIKPSYIRRGSWLKFFTYSNSLCTRASRAITNHVLWQPLVTMTNNYTSSKSLNRISSRDHKRTQQGVSAELLPYLYKLHMVHATNNYSCPNVYVLSISIPCVYYEVAMQLTYSLISPI